MEEDPLNINDVNLDFGDIDLSSLERKRSSRSDTGSKSSKGMGKSNRSRKGDLSIIEENLEGERSSDIDVITARAALQDNKVKSQRSKKSRRKKDKGSKDKGSKDKGRDHRSRKKLSRRQKQEQGQKKTKMEELRKLKQIDMALLEGQDDNVQESIDWIEKAYEDKKQREYLQSVEPQQPLDEDPIQMILKYAMSDNEPSHVQGELERLSQKEEDARKLIHDFDFSKYNRGKVLQYEGEIDPYLLDQYPVDLLPTYFFKNIEALTDIYNRLYGNENPLYIQDQSQLIEIPENIYEKLLKPFSPYFVSSPYYYGTKEVRPPYNETDVLAYEKLAKNWEELLKNAYGDEMPPILEPLTPDELNISPELLESVDSDEKSELKKYYLKVRDAYVLLDRIEMSPTLIEELLQEKKDYYSAASIKDCLEIQKLKLDQVSKNINLTGTFADLHLSLCTDNKMLTEIYIRNFEKLPSQLIMPDARSYVAGVDSNNSSFLNLMRDVANDPRLSIYIPQCVFSSVFKYLRGRRFYTEGYGARVQDRTIYATPCNLSFLIAQSFKRMDPNETTYVRVSDMYLTPLQVGEFERDYIIQINDGDGLSGIDHLRMMLQQIEDDCPERINIPGFDVEKSKRFIILMLMGLVNAHHYKDNLIFLEQMWGEKIMKASSQLEAHEKKLSDKLSKYEEAVNRNTLLEGEWILSLIDDLKKLYNYFNNKLEHYEVKYGDDYDDYFRPYYPPTR